MYIGGLVPGSLSNIRSSSQPGSDDLIVESLKVSATTCGRLRAEQNAAWGQYGVAVA
jgi:hypothetical protein